MQSWIKVGAQCVCIDDKPGSNRNWRGRRRVVAGVTYTIRGIRITPLGVCVLTFNEIVNPIVPVVEGGRMEWGFNSIRFRPVVPIANDLALFTHHLHQTEELV